ncbi:MAG: tetraacyldisaccharide 4'-kinase [Acidobacteria bacterium]|nr:tetraacyldisaccharide 4'-kinase [Acidobacteriota bacterium]
MLDLLYARAARWRRRAAQRPGGQRRLHRPVVSIGTLSVGGTGKSPVVAALASWLVARGERPAILSRGYRRRTDVPGVTVVSDGQSLLASLARSGDEPLMLARAVPGAVVCVCPDRYLSGVLAERRLGATVHLLDDGFQHLSLARDLDVLVTSAGEITGGHVLPRGRLREPADAASHADVLVVMGADSAAAADEARALGVGIACGATRALGEPLAVGTAITSGVESRREGIATGGGRRGPGVGSTVVVACGIANPQRFVGDVTAVGYQVARAVTFPDHHDFSARDVARIAAAVSETGAAAVFTTDKDAVRFEAVGTLPFPLFRVPMTLTFDPPDVLFDAVAALLQSPITTPSRRDLTPDEMPSRRDLPPGAIPTRRDPGASA